VLRGQGDDAEILIASTPFLRGHSVATGELLWELRLSTVQVVPGLVLTDDLVIQAGSVHNKRIIAYRLVGSGPETRGEKLWEEPQAAPELASPVLYEGLLFTVSDVGVLTCFRPDTGEVLWRERLRKGDYRSSIVAGDGKLYVTSMGSVTSVVAAEETFRLLATNDLAEISESSLAVSRECLLVRTEDHLYCVGAEAA
jgi:outer membrane protein assembly factor BamB